MPETPLAFVDVETTGFNPKVDRITEIGVVTVEEGRVEEWVSLVKPGGWRRERLGLPGVDDEAIAAAPVFKAIAREVAARLAGKLFVAHNARFDHGFVCAELRRAGIAFEPAVLCSMMLSRRLYAQASGHDLDALIERHAIPADVRHRALPDARALWQFWQAIEREHPKERLAQHIRALLAGPILPAHLDPALIDRLPEAPGVYVLHGPERPLHIGTAGNLRLEVLNYFRLDRATPRALAVSHLVTDITWRATQGALGARLQRAVVAAELPPATKARVSAYPWSWRFVPDRTPAVALFPLSEWTAGTDAFGIFDTERRARNTLARLAKTHGLCHALLGIVPGKRQACTQCHAEAGCGRESRRPEYLMRAFTALLPLRLKAWPYAGPIGIREGADLHVIADWRYLGTARDENEVEVILASRRGRFDRGIFETLERKIPRLPGRRILDLRAFASSRATRLPVEAA